MRDGYGLQEVDQMIEVRLRIYKESELNRGQPESPFKPTLVFPRAGQIVPGSAILRRCARLIYSWLHCLRRSSGTHPTPSMANSKEHRITTRRSWT